MDAETAHHVALRQLSLMPPALLRLFFGGAAQQPAHVFGISFPTRVGLAAGMDKNGVALSGWEALGFGFVEIDLRWLGISWDEGPHEQSERRPHYFAAWRRLKEAGFLYPCTRSRKDVAGAALAPHEEEPIFPVDWRMSGDEAGKFSEPGGVNWRFRVPDGETQRFVDGRVGEVRRTGQKDFGDFLVWNRENVPAYELAVVVDDIAMGITEVVRGEDLLTSTARQLLLYRALGAEPPRFYHCPLVRDAAGRRLAKRDSTMTLRALRECGWTPEDVLRFAAAK